MPARPASRGRDIHEMRSEDMDGARDNLARFLCEWLVGSKPYQKKYGPISIPGIHQHLDIGVSERFAWLKCLCLALEEQPYSNDFRDCLVQQLAIPAERIRMVCQSAIQKMIKRTRKTGSGASRTG
ncbi:MAG: globin [Gammaproteobacteria bacterium]|nr:globin [Gammaproteobacteria bacterium]